MGPGDIILVALWTLLAHSAHARVIRQAKDQDNEDTPRCRTYSLSSLIHVDCSDKGLTELPDTLNQNVQVLLLSENSFTAFPEQIENFSQLEILDMSTNKLSIPLPSFFERLDKLHTLNLSNNNYDVWFDSPLPNLKKLDLSKNKIQHIYDDAFTRTGQLKLLDLAENRIQDLPTNLFTSANNLEILILCRNYFSNFPRFESDSLKSLHLNNCQISEIKQDSLTEMVSLLELYLSMNEIERIPDNFSSNTLQELDLSYNYVSELTDNSFSSLPHLAVLNLRGNDFKEVWSTSHFASNPFLREVLVKGNRWSCENFSLNLLLLYEFFTKEPSKVSKDKESLICYSPSNVTQMNWQQAYIRTRHPSEEAPISYTTVAVLIGIIIGVVITSCVCRGLMAVNRESPPRQTTVLNLNGTTTPQPSTETSVLRIQLREDLPPSYDEALLMPRLNASFHSLPDFVDEEEPAPNHRRSRSIGDLTEYRPRTHDRRSMRRVVQITSNDDDQDDL